MKQTFLTVYRDAAGNMTSFNRWRYKNAQTCVKKEMELLKNSLYSTCIKTLEKSVSMEVIETPDGYNHGRTVLTMAI